MSTYTNLLFHIIYSTKYRKPSIDPLWQDELYAYIGGILRDNRGVLLKAGGIEDHIHLLAKLPPTIAVSDMLRLMKANSSKWINETKKPKHRNPWARAHGYTISSLRDYGTAKQRRSVENTSVMRVSRMSSLPMHDKSAIDVDGLSRHMCSPIR